MPTGKQGHWASSLQVRVIALRSPDRLLHTVRRLFPFADVGVQSAIDVRRVPVEKLHRQDLISHSAEHSLRYGRRWHHEVGTRGAVGLAHAVRLALEEAPDRPLLLFEEDCVIDDEERLLRELERLMQATSLWDMAFFGTFGPAKKRCTRTATFMDEALGPDASKNAWRFVDNGIFWGLHCGVYLPSARAHVAARLRGPLEMQIDSLYSKMSSRGEVRIVVQVDRSTAMQDAHHASSVQESVSLRDDDHVEVRQEASHESPRTAEWIVAAAITTTVAVAATTMLLVWSRRTWRRIPA